MRVHTAIIAAVVMAGCFAAAHAQTPPATTPDVVPEAMPFDNVRPGNVICLIRVQFGPAHKSGYHHTVRDMHGGLYSTRN